MMKLQASRGGTMSRSQLELSKSNKNNQVISSPYHAGHKTLLPGCFDMSYGGSDRWNNMKTTGKSLCRQTTIATKEREDLANDNDNNIKTLIDSRLVTKITTTMVGTTTTTNFDVDAGEKDQADNNGQSCRYLTDSFFTSSSSSTEKPVAGQSGINDDTDDEQLGLSPRSTLLTVNIEEEEKKEEDYEEEYDDWDYEVEYEYYDEADDEEEGYTLDPTYHTFEDDDISDLTDDEGFELYDILDQLFCGWIEDEDNLDGGSFVEYLSDGTVKVIDGEPIFASSSSSDDENENINNYFGYDEEDVESVVVNTVELPHLLGTFYDELLEPVDY